MLEHAFLKNSRFLFFAPKIKKKQKCNRKFFGKVLSNEVDIFVFQKVSQINFLFSWLILFFSVEKR